jgi:electron transfer flavoprotein beta subunit
MGADRGILVKTDGNVEPLAVAKILKAIVDEEKPGLVILGKQAIDDDSNQTGQMLAALLGWSQGTFASKLEVDGDRFQGDARSRRRPADREAEAAGDRHHRSAAQRAALRFLPNIMKAKKKPIADKSAGRLRRRLTPRLEVLKTTEPPGRKAGVKVKDVAELVSKLKNEAGVL